MIDHFLDSAYYSDMSRTRVTVHVTAVGAALVGAALLLDGDEVPARSVLLLSQAVVAVAAGLSGIARWREDRSARVHWTPFAAGAFLFALTGLLSTAWLNGLVDGPRIFGAAGWAVLRSSPSVLMLTALALWPRAIQRGVDALVGVLDAVIFASAGFILLGWFSLSAYMRDPALGIDRRTYVTITAVLGISALGLLVFQHARQLPSMRGRFAEYQVAIMIFVVQVLLDPIAYRFGRQVPFGVFNLMGTIGLLFVYRAADAPVRRLLDDSLKVPLRAPMWVRAVPIAVVVLVAVLSLHNGDSPDPILILAGILMMVALISRESTIAAELRILSSSLEGQVGQRTRELEESRHALAQSQRLEAVGRVAASVAHDFRNLLAGIRAIAESEQEDLPADSPLREPLQHVLEAVDRGVDMTRDLMTFAQSERTEPTERTSTDVAALLGRMIPLWRRQIPAEITLVHDTPPGTQRSITNAKRIERVLTNLVLNARDAIAGAGSITVGVATVDVDATMASRIPDALAGTFLCVSVSDTGTGMTPDITARLFEPYFTTKAEGKGTGLGLSTSYGLVRRSGGFINVLTAPGSGTRFEVYLPLSDGQRA
jgi:signal transduction histidine kinase